MILHIRLSGLYRRGEWLGRPERFEVERTQRVREFRDFICSQGVNTSEGNDHERKDRV